MSKYATLIAQIAANIRRNGAQAITGDLLQEQLLAMITSLGEYYQFGGLVSHDTEFTPGDEPVVFVAATPGTYTNFGGLVVAEGEVALLVWSGSAWSKQTTDIATRTEVSQLGQYVAKQKSYILSTWMQDIYTSSTDNYLDVSNVIRGFRVGTDGSLIEDAYGVISRFIYVGDAQGGSMTISLATTPIAPLQLVFLKSAKIATTEYIDYYNINQSRTITIPGNAKYAVMNFRNSIYSGLKNYDYSGMKISKSSSAATQAFDPVYLGNADAEEFWWKEIATKEYVDNDIKEKTIFTSSSDNVLDTSVSPCGLRITDNSPYFVPSGEVVISDPIPVRGAQFTWKTKLNTDYIRWLAFCSSIEKTAENVISVINPGFALNTSAEQSVTLNIPNGTRYIFVNLGTINNRAVDDTAAFGGIATNDSYEKAIFGYDDVPILGCEKNESSSVIDFEKADTLKRFIPYSVGSPSDGLSYDNQYQRANILFFTDSHIGGTIVNSLMLGNVKEVVDFINAMPFAIDATIHGGDIIHPYGIVTKSAGKNIATQFFNECKKVRTPFIFSKGNHDTNDWGNLTTNAFNDSDWSEMWYNWAESNYGIVRQTKQSGEKSTWHYYDIVGKKIRIVCLDVQDVDKELANESGKVIYYGSVAFYISNEQFNWVANTALDFDSYGDDKEGWGVIFVSHQDTRYGFSLRNPNNFEEIADWEAGAPYVVGNLVKYSSDFYRCKVDNSDNSWDASHWDKLNPENDIVKFAAMLQAFNTQGSYQQSYSFPSVPFYSLSVNADWTRYSNLNNPPSVICWLVGHEHCDFNTAVNGINIIGTLNSCCDTSSSDSRVARIANSPSQNAFDLISIDKRTRKIRYVRYGAGKNCYGNGGDRFIPEGLSY